MATAVARFVVVELSDRAVGRAVAAVLKRAGKDGEVSVAFVGTQRMRTLNRTYHGEDRATDVLAFGQLPIPSRKRRAKATPFLGEIVICPQVSRRNAAHAGEPVRRELIRLIVHGTLHLLGHDHAIALDAARMFALQEQIVVSLTLRR